MMLQNRVTSNLNVHFVVIERDGGSSPPYPTIWECSSKVEQLAVNQQAWVRFPLLPHLINKFIYCFIIKFQGLWEVEFAKYLDNKNIKWERPHKTYKYIFENENHRYLPDFYLPEYNLYIEIKGYPTKRDFYKWEQFTDNLDVYFGDDLYNLGIIESYKDIYKLIDKKFRIKHIEI